jgi:hypothetical protein
MPATTDDSISFDTLFSYKDNISGLFYDINKHLSNKKNIPSHI